MTAPIDLDAAIVIALGSSLPGRFDSASAAIEAALARLPQAAVKVVARSSLWRSAAWPDPADPPFVNAVALVESPLPPRTLLAFLVGLEASLGRSRGEANGPRVIDLDLVAYGRERIETAGLTLPHPRAAERRFVMGPLAEIAPEWRHPVLGSSAAELAAAATVGADASPID